MYISLSWIYILMIFWIWRKISLVDNSGFVEDIFETHILWHKSNSKILTSNAINICGTTFNYTKGNLLHIIFALFLSLTLTQVSDPSIFCVHEFHIMAVAVFVITWLLLPLFLPKQRLVDFFIALLPLHVSLLCN